MKKQKVILASSVVCLSFMAGCHQTVVIPEASIIKEDKCSNRMYDPGEEGLDCGGTCAPCSFCKTDADCNSGFCDSALGFICSTRCQSNADCVNPEAWDGEYCRSDGRCSPKIFEIVIEITEPGKPVALLHDCTFKNNYQFQILWGDELPGTRITDTPLRGTYFDDFFHTYEKAGQYHIQIIGKYDNWTNPFERYIDQSVKKIVKKDVITSASNKKQDAYSDIPENTSEFGLEISETHYSQNYSQLLDAVDAENDEQQPNEQSKKTNSPQMNPLLDSYFSLDPEDTHEDYEYVYIFKPTYEMLKTEISLALPFKFSESYSDAARRMIYAVREIKSYGPVGMGAGGLDLPHIKSYPHTDIPDATKLANQSLASMFSIDYNQPVRWDTRYVTNMSYMFKDALAFNQPVNLDTSQVTNMSGMFYNAEKFNQPLNLDTSKVTDMSIMFMGASAFNQKLAFNTSQVTNMRSMFHSARAYQQAVNFDTSNVTNMSYMFAYASKFNQPVNFDTSQVTSMQGMFESAQVFNQPVNFDTHNVTDMSRFLLMARNFNQPLNFDTAKVTNMEMMFKSASNFNQPIAFSDTSQVTNMSHMFSKAYAFNQPVKFNTSKVTNMEQMFADATSFNQPVKFDTSHVTDMTYMFWEAKSFNQPVKFDTRQVKSMRGMFRDAKSFNQPVKFNLSSIKTTKDMFSGADAYTYDTSKYQIPEKDNDVNKMRKPAIDLPF